MTELLTLSSPETKFEFVSGDGDVVKASTTPDGKKMLHGVASSTTRDLHGDVILQSALDDMERTAVGMTIFRNHQYSVPEDVMGTVTKAIIRQKGVDHDGNPNYQLEFDIEIEDENEHALKTWRYVQKGRKLGLSIGAMIPKDGAQRQKDGSWIIAHVNLLETSLVGIPANPKSWVDYAASALRGMVEKATTSNLGSPTLTLEGGRYRIEGELAGLDLNLGGEPSQTVEAEFHFQRTADGKTAITRTVDTDEGDGSHLVEQTLMGAWDLSDEDDRLLAIATTSEEIVQRATVWVETRDGDTITIGEPESKAADDAVTASVDPEISDGKKPCSECGKTNCDHDGDLHDAAPDPDVTDAKIRIIEVDTDAPSSGGDQGASGSEPDDAEYAAPVADVTASGDEPLILEDLPIEQLAAMSFRQLQAVALKAVSELVTAKRALDEEKAARIAVEKQRDEVAEAAAELVKRTAAVIEKVGSAPLARKAVLRDVKKEFSSSVEAYYGTEFARVLASK